MKRTLNALILLYPKPWRERYRKEFEALLEDVPPTWRTLLDVVGGAMKMQLKGWNPWKLVASVGIVGALQMGAYTLMMPKQYVSHATLKYVDPSKLTSASKDILSRKSLTHLVVEEDLYHAERARLPIEDVVEQMKLHDIVIRPLSTPTGDFAYTISFQAPDAARAQRTTRRLTSMFLSANVGSLVNPANLPVDPTGPRASRNMIIGLVLGILVGTLVALFNGLKVWKLGGALGLAGLLTGACFAYWLPTQFRSTALIRSIGPGSDSIHRLAFAVLEPRNLDATIARHALYPHDPDPRKKFMENLRFKAGSPGLPAGSPGPDAIEIQFDYRDRVIAQEVTGDIASQIIDAAFRNRGVLASGQTLELLDPPTLPWRPISPNWPMIEGVGLFAGLAAAIGVGAFRHARPRSLQMPSTT